MFSDEAAVCSLLLKALQSRLIITTKEGTTFRVPKSEYVVLNKEGDVMAMFVEGRKLRILDTQDIKLIKTENGPTEQK